MAALPLLASATLPWVLLRANRLAAGEAQHLNAAHLALWLGGVLLWLLSALLRPRWAWLSANLLPVLAAWLFGAGASAALVGQADFARASASSGLWLALLGAGAALYSAASLSPSENGASADRPLKLAHPWRAWLWLPPLLWLLLTGHLGHWSLLIEAHNERERWVQEFIQHLRLVVQALGLACLLGLPASVWLRARPRPAQVTLLAANAIQTVPSLALLGLLIAPLAALSSALPVLRTWGVSGIGTAPALTAMTLYALLPILRFGLLGLQAVPAEVQDAARGMGMTGRQRLWQVDIPLALPVWFSGVRQAAVMLVGVAALAALIGAGGLGTYIFKGLQSGAADLILLGALPATGLALLVNAGLLALERSLKSRVGQA